MLTVLVEGDGVVGLILDLSLGPLLLLLTLNLDSHDIILRKTQ